MLFVTDGAWGTGIHRLKEPEEIDADFWEVLSSINSVINNPIQPVQLTGIRLENGNALFFDFDDNTSVGPIYIPIQAFHWRDEWAPNTPYFTNDIFKVTGVGLYYVIQSHTSGDTFDKAILVGSDPALLEMFAFASGGRVIIEDTTARTLSLGDAESYIRTTNGASIIITIPPDADVALDIGITVAVEQAAAGAASFVAGSGVLINCAATHIPTSNGQFAVIQAKKVAANEWTVFGNLVPA